MMNPTKTLVDCFVPGKPQGKGRHRSAFVKGRIMQYPDKKTSTYEAYIRGIVLSERQIRVPSTKPLKIHVEARMPIPISWPAWKMDLALRGEIEPTGRPDLDNVVKAVKDSLNGVLWRDDSLVTSCFSQKVYHTIPGVHILVEELTTYSSAITRKSELKSRQSVLI